MGNESCSVKSTVVDQETEMNSTIQQSSQSSVSFQNENANNSKNFNINDQTNDSSRLFDNESCESNDTFQSYDESNSNLNRNTGDLNEISNENANIDDILSNSVGYVKPYWVPDKDAPNCLLCNSKFNLINRRHHCRACGTVACSLCCHYFIRLPYLNFKEGRVCKVCVNLLDNCKYQIHLEIYSI